MPSKIQPEQIGLPSLHARVESWECDFNGHWNARFYVRSFQLAAETLPHLAGLTAQPSAFSPTRTIWFHQELFPGAVVKIRSARIADGPHAGATVHLLTGDGQLSATALDRGGVAIEGLPEVSGDQVKLAHPRSLNDDQGWTDGPGTSICEAGPIRPYELDHTGMLLTEDITRRGAFAIHSHVSALGLNADYLAKTGISRMSVETRIRPLAPLPAGTPLRVRSRISHRAVKSFRMAQILESHAGEPVAFIEHSLLTVDLNTRRAVELPQFLRQEPT